MQYGVEIYPYQRAKKRGQSDGVKIHIDSSKVKRLLFYFTMSALISRVILINFTAPFGIAFMLVMLHYKEDNLFLISSIGICVGYLSLINSSIKYLGTYFLCIGIIFLLELILKKIDFKKQLIVQFISIACSSLIYLLYFHGISLSVALLSISLQMICIIPLYYILNYSIVCLQKNNDKFIYENEEILSLALLAAFVVGGTWGITIFNTSFRNIIGLTFVLVIGYINGGEIGSACGVVLGIIVGMATKNMAVYISIFAISGLITGVFKESGKYFSIASFILAAFILLLYGDSSQYVKLSEILTSAVIFSVVPNKVYENLVTKFANEGKKYDMEDDFTNKLKSVLIDKLNNFSNVLFSMSDILSKIVDNDKLLQKNKSSAVVGNLADRVCMDCSMQNMCWKRELHYTYGAFEELIDNYQHGIDTLPYEIERKCIKRTALSKNAEQLVNTYIISQMWEKRMSESRELISDHIKNMANSVDEIVDEFKSSIHFDSAMSIKVKMFLDKNKIIHKDVICYYDKYNRIHVNITLHACGGKQLCVKNILPIISQVTNKCMCVSDEGCCIDPNNYTCNIVFDEMPKFHVSSSAIFQCKNGEECSGDSYNYDKLSDGTYMIMISDGMGSGPEASRESKSVIELIEKLFASGFTKSTAINTVNSVMTLKFSEDEKFSTVDLCNIDLYKGEAEFIKVGASASFIKRDGNVKCIDSRTLPIGVLDNADVETTNVRINNGDMIIMISDGVLDYNNENAGNTQWIYDYLISDNSANPKDLAEGIINKAKELSKNIIRDDMTVIVSKIYNLF